ncbi:hypothetical protein GCM10028808_25970 [Spirosoma migulaei]
MAPVSQPTQAQIDAAASEAQSQGRVINITPGGITIPAALQEVASLPVTFRSTIGNWNYDITVLSMSFTPTGSVLSMGCRFYLPGSTTSTSLYFGANDIAVSGKSGFNGDLPILESLLSDAKSNELDDPAGKLGGQTKFVEFPVPAFQGKAWVGLGKDTKLSFTCGEFKKFSLSGFLKVYDLVEREDPAGQSLTDGKPLLFFWGTKDVFDWQDMYFPVTASRGFHSANADDIGFHPTDKTNALLDLSTYQSPANLPDCGGGSLGDSWQGIQFDAFAIRLPKLFKLRNPHTLMGQGTNLFLSPNGVIGTVTADKVFALEEGYTDEINKFDLSLDQVTANFSCGASASISMSGRFRLGTCGTGAEKAKELYYNVVYTEQDRLYQVLIKESATDRFKNNGLTLSTGSTLSLSIQNESFVFQTALPAKPRLSTPAYNNSICVNYPTTLTVSNCESISSKWSTGEADKGTVTINPKATTTYKINCFDKYCINEDSDDLTITVYESLPQPTLTSTSLAFCTYQNASLRADQCVGKLEWQTPDNTTFRELSSNQQTAYFPGQAATATFAYTVRCNLNTCLSPEKPLSLTVYPEPKAPSLWSSATNNTIDRNNSVTISGSCLDNNSIVWDNLPQATVKLASSTTYSAYCKNPGTGCQTQSHSSIGINVLYFPPAGPSPVTFGSVGTNYLTVNWRDNSDNEDGFWVYRDTSPAFSNSVRVGDVGANVTSFIDYNLAEGATYYYRIISHNRYDNGYSEVASRATGITPDKPILTASSTNIERGSNSNVSGYCRIGTLIWVTPSTFSGGSYTQTDATTYTAKCSSGGIESGASYLTVTVFVKPVVIPCSTPGKPIVFLNGQGQDVTITKGESVQVSASCPPGSSLMWTQGTDGNGSNLAPTGNTYYAAKCKSDNGDCQSEEGGRVVWVNDKVAPPGPECAPPGKPVVYLNGQGQDVTITKGESVQVSASCPPGSSVVWTQGTDGNGSNLSPTGNTYYAAKCKNDNGGCQSEEGGRVVWVKDKVAPPGPDCTQPGKPVVYLNGQNQDVTIIKGESVQVSASCPSGSNVVWTQGTDGNGSNLSPTGNTYYAAKCKQDACLSEEGGRVVWVKDNPDDCIPPGKPVVYINGRNQDITITKGESVQVSASCPPGSSVVWTRGTDGNGSNLSPTGDTYYATKCKNDKGGCLGEEGGQVVRVKTDECTPPSAPVVYLNGQAQEITINKGASVNVSASCPPGSSVVWTQGTDGSSNLSPTGDTYYAARCQSDNGGCQSGEGGQIVRVKTEDTIDILTYTGQQVLCNGESSTPRSFAGCEGGSVRVLLVQNGELYTTDGLVPDKEYAAICAKAGRGDVSRTTFGISSGRAPANLVINENANGSTVTLTASSSGVKSYKWSTGATDASISVSTDNTYSVTAYSDYSQQGCTASVSKSVTIRKPSQEPVTPAISSLGTTVCENKDSGLTLSVTNCNGTLSWSTGKTTQSITVYTAGKYTAYCTLEGKTVQSDIIISNNVPKIEIMPPAPPTSTRLQIRSIDGCTNGIKWTRMENGRVINLTSSNPSYIDIRASDYGQYEATCSNECGSSSTTYTVRP